MTEEKRHTITTTQGVEVEIRLVPPFRLDRVAKAVRDEFIARKLPVETPQYQLSNGQWADHNETTLETEDDRRMWAAHLDAVARLEEETLERQRRVLVNRGIANEPPDDDDWAADAIADGLTVPTDPIERKIMWIEEVLAPVITDRVHIETAIRTFGSQGIVESGDVAARIDFFRRFNNLTWDEFGALVAKLVEAAEQAAMADAPGAGGDVDGAGVGADAGAVA